MRDGCAADARRMRFTVLYQEQMNTPVIAWCVACWAGDSRRMRAWWTHSACMVTHSQPVDEKWSRTWQQEVV
jgi:hypothetical protein